MMEFLSTDKWVWVDYTIAGIIAFFAVSGFLRGFVKELFSLFAWVAAVGLATKYCHEFSAYFQGAISYPPARIALAYAGLFISTLIVGRIIAFLLGQLLEKTGLSASDRLLGFGFGMLKGGVLTAILVMLAGLTHLPNDPWWKQSQLLSPFQSLAVWLKDNIPSSLADIIKYR